MKMLFEAMKPKESEIKREIRAYLRLRGIWHYNSWQGQFSEPGIADLIGIYKGRYLAIEVKVPGRKATDKQQAFLDRVREEGGIGFVAWSVEDVMGVLK